MFSSQANNKVSQGVRGGVHDEDADGVGWMSHSTGRWQVGWRKEKSEAKGHATTCFIQKNTKTDKKAKARSTTEVQDLAQLSNGQEKLGILGILCHLLVRAHPPLPYPALLFIMAIFDIPV